MENVDSYLIEFPLMGTARTPGDTAFCLFVDTIGSLSDFLFFCCASKTAHLKRGLEGAVGDSDSAVFRSFPVELGAVVYEYFST